MALLIFLPWIFSQCLLFFFLWTHNCWPEQNLVHRETLHTEKVIVNTFPTLSCTQWEKYMCELFGLCELAENEWGIRYKNIKFNITGQEERFVEITQDRPKFYSCWILNFFLFALAKSDTKKRPDSDEPETYKQKSALKQKCKQWLRNQLKRIN
jgi:hypothetical protein